MEQSIDVLDHHNAAVDKQSNGDGQPAQRHEVGRHAKDVHPQGSKRNGEWDGQKHDYAGSQSIERDERHRDNQHERFDGTGSPDKLMRKDIPLGSRIIAVVDTYDNVLNNRITFGAATPEQTWQYIQKRTPKQFDPDVVSALHLCLHARARDLDYDENELEVDIKDLLSGMVLSRDLLTDQGVLLLSKGTRITPSNRKRLLMLLPTHPTLSSIFAYRPEQHSGREGILHIDVESSGKHSKAAF